MNWFHTNLQWLNEQISSNNIVWLKSDYPKERNWLNEVCSLYSLFFAVISSYKFGEFKSVFIFVTLISLSSFNGFLLELAVVYVDEFSNEHFICYPLLVLLSHFLKPNTKLWIDVLYPYILDVLVYYEIGYWLCLGCGLHAVSVVDVGKYIKGVK